MLAGEGSWGSTEGNRKEAAETVVQRGVLEVTSSVLLILSQLCLLFHWHLPKQHRLESGPLPHLPFPGLTCLQLSQLGDQFWQFCLFLLRSQHLA